MKIIAVVVTYNRLELLKRNIRCLRMNKPLTSIVVVNNDSTDGTLQWLDTQSDLHVITQKNLGGSGGFYVGMKYAFNNNADYVWCMDDDVYPQSNCLEQLLLAATNSSIGILAPRRIIGNKIYTNDFQKYNLTNPFVGLRGKKLKNQIINYTTDIVGTAFEGPLISRNVIRSVGLPNKDFFIFCDDTDYCLRTVLTGYRILYVPSALMDKEPFFSSDDWSTKERKKKWKRFYNVRDRTYLNHHYGKNILVKYLRSFYSVIGQILIAIFSSVYDRSDVKRFWKAYCDGIKERLGVFE